MSFLHLAQDLKFSKQAVDDKKAVDDKRTEPAEKKLFHKTVQMKYT